MKKAERVELIVKTLENSHLDTNNINEAEAMYYMYGYDKNTKLGDLIDAIELLKAASDLMNAIGLIC